MNAIYAQFKRLAWAATVLAAKIVVEPLQVFRRPSIAMSSLAGMRYPYYLVAAFATQGPIVIPARELGRACRFFGFRRAMTDFRLIPSSSTPKLTHDHDADPNAIVVSETYFDPARHGDFWAPYFAHPNFYLAGMHETCRGLRASRRSVRLFFAGTHAIDAYRTSFLFPMLSRSEIVDFIRTRYAVLLDKVMEVLTPGGHRFVFSVTGNTKNSIDKHKLDLNAYLEKLAASDFFLCPPGFMVPHSHNVIEAMSVGAIPVCNYGQYLHPPLVDGVNCLAFDTLDELDAVLTRIDSLKDEEILNLRRGVIEYYDGCVDPSVFARTFLARADETKRLVVNAAEDDRSAFIQDLRHLRASKQVTEDTKLLEGE
jgi:hypothetical protein